MQTAGVHVPRCCVFGLRGKPQLLENVGEEGVLKLSDEQPRNEGERLPGLGKFQMKCRREKCGAVAVRPTHGLCQRHRDIETRKLGRVKVPNAPVVAHIEKLRAGGLGWARIAELAGLSFSTVRGVLNYDLMLAKNARAILAVPLPDSRFTMSFGGAKVPILGTRRRLRALIALGYTNQQVCDAIGYARPQFYGLLYGNDLVTAATARSVQRVFDELQMVRPPDSTPARRSIARAKRNGWAPPLAWDEDDIDDPAGRPHVKPPTLSPDWYEEYLDLKALGLNEGQAAARMGVHQSTLSKRLSRRAA